MFEMIFSSCFPIQGKFWISLLVCGASFGVVMVTGVAISARLMMKKKYKKEANYDIIILEEMHQSVPELLNFEIPEEEVEYCNMMSHRLDIDSFVQAVARKKTYDTLFEEFQVGSKLEAIYLINTRYRIILTDF
jgi:hypothetical protein